MAWVDFVVGEGAWGVGLGFTMALCTACTPGLAERPLDAAGTGTQTTTTAGDSETTLSVETTDTTDTTDTTGSTTAAPSDETAAPPPPCETWCGGYPSKPGCDEDDEGINAEGTGDDGSFDEGPTSGGDESGLGMGDDIPLATDIYAVRQGDVDIGLLIEFAEVIVTSPPATQPDGEGLMFTLGDPDGGLFSGITVRAPNSEAYGDLSPGDVVTLTGIHQQRYVFALIDATDGTLTVHRTAPMPDPVVIMAEDLQALAPGGDMVVGLESVVVRVLEPEVVDDAPCEGEFEIQANLRIDDRFLVANGEGIPTVPAGGYSAIAGPLLYTYNGLEIAPRTLADMQQ